MTRAQIRLLVFYYARAIANKRGNYTVTNEMITTVFPQISETAMPKPTNEAGLLYF
jgi:hypothetical protein